MKIKEGAQHRLWKGSFGNAYLDRNSFTPKTLDDEYRAKFGVARSTMNKNFLAILPKDIRILEVGTNFGMQLSALQKLGFKNLYGIELNPRTVVIAHKTFPAASIVQGDALDLPFKDGYFDLVFTSGVLIHIAPKNRKRVMSEIYRVSKKYIWGFEYFAEKSTEIPYRGHRNVLWKAPFRKLYQDTFSDLKLMREKKYQYLGSANIDEMFLLKRGR